jgi:acyl-CoA synthetase (AMP-forming)/AMP-acid ligase II
VSHPLVSHPPVSHQPFDYVSRWADETPDAAFFRDGQQSVSFAEARQHVLQISSALRELGVRPGQLVGLELPTGLQVLFSCAVMHEAAVSFVHGPRSEGSSVTADWIFTTSPRPAPSFPSSTRVVTVDGEFLRNAAARSIESDARRYPSGESLFRITFSSGTTGAPKAVVLSLEMAHHRALAALDLFDDRQPFLSMLDLGTASGFHTFLGAVMTGQCFYNPGDARHNLALITGHGVTAVKASPVQLSELCREARAQQKTLEPLATVYAAGSTTPVALRHELRALGVRRTVSLYGSTEAGRCAERVLDDDNLTNLGPVVAGTTLQIVDAHGTELPAGTEGFVRYARPFQALEYLNDSETTARIFRDGFFHTGDLGYVSAQGDLILAGRAADVVNAGGVKVNLADLENTAQAHPGVADAAAFIYSDQNDVEQLALALRSSPDCNLTTLTTELTRRFGSLAPRTVVKMAQIPRNAAGKIDRQTLRRLYEDALTSQ